MSNRVPISVQLDATLLKDASHCAVDLGITRTELINRAVGMFLHPCEEDAEWFPKRADKVAAPLREHGG